MKSNSDHYPELQAKSNNKTQVNYDIILVTKEDMDGAKRERYEYEYVEIDDEVTRAKIINAVIANVYNKDVELALINNELASPGTVEYAEYQVLRMKAKEVAAMVLGSVL